jgi:ubiquinone/menaquinone biosynthesis C-methylase UbiE
MEGKNSWDPIWEEVFTSQEWGKYPGESLIQFVARNFYKLDRKKIKLLEVGCGTGANIWYMSRENFDVYGIDGSKSAIEIATKRIADERLTATLKVGDIVNLPYQENHFDAVIDNECLYANDTANSNLILSEIYRVLKPGAMFYSRTFSNDMYVGENLRSKVRFEFKDISDGPLAGKGFVRLIDRVGINELYGKYFQIKSIDKLEYTRNNGSTTISEWVIISQKI